MTGPNPILESLENEWDAGKRWTAAHFSHHRHPQTPATTPVNLAAAPAAAAKQEDTMSVIDDLEGFIADVKALGPQALADVKALGAAAVADLKTVKANPETAVVLGNLSLLAKVAGEVGIPVGAITDIAKPIEALLKLYAPDPAAPAPVQQPVPAQ